MEKLAKVTNLSDDGFAFVNVIREGSCGGDCKHCAGCGANTSLTARVRNTAHANVDDLVIVETSDSLIVYLSALVYLMPFVLFFAFYFAFQAFSENIALIIGGIGFLISILILKIANRKFKSRVPIKIIRIFNENEGK